MSRTAQLGGPKIKIFIVDYFALSTAPLNIIIFWLLELIRILSNSWFVHDVTFLFFQTQTRINNRFLFLSSESCRCYYVSGLVLCSFDQSSVSWCLSVQGYHQNSLYAWFNYLILTTRCFIYYLEYDSDYYHSFESIFLSYQWKIITHTHTHLHIGMIRLNTFLFHYYNF